MNKIFKYELEIVGEQVLKLHQGSRILSIQNQNDKLQMWCMVDEDDPIVSETFYICGTGQEITDPFIEYIDSVQISDFVWHIFRTDQRFKNMIDDKYKG